eukprot:TRINITY_DN19965_c0_g1_i1.p1 TRINITY_DN19965_c0_g1~~TRINITY_DN19965_c0_g1_i1.p1  ORF type:complete len:857 (+),score=103.47 TRINITY_DN19965_c0_g1_i1:59-2629(+)
MPIIEGSEDEELAGLTGDLEGVEEGISLANRRGDERGSAAEKCDALLRRVHEVLDVHARPTYLTVEQRELQQEYQTLDYIGTYSNVSKRHIEIPKVQDSIMKWLLFAAVGISCGLLAFFMRQTIDLINEKRMKTVANLLNVSGGGNSKQYFLAWLYLVGTSGALALCASLIVVLYWKSAAGSGVEEVIAYLNGVDMPRVFNVRTAIVKFFSCIASVSSGLPAGPEGPMIHLGAICGAGLTQGRSKTLGVATKVFRKYRNAKDHRDFITAGAAAGISAAFGAPIGGLLFVMEEMSTHWKPSLTWMIFFTSMASFCTVSLFNSAFDAWVPTGTFGWFLNKAAVLFEVKTIIQLNILAIFPSFIIGTLGGIFGGLFTILNVKINQWRKRTMNTNTKRILEPVVVVVLFSTAGLLLPMMMGCSPVKTAETEGERKMWVTENSTYLATFLCDSPDKYSPLGTLTMGGNEGTIRRLFSRHTNLEFGGGVLFLYFVLYFVFACYTAGMSISSGLLVPMIVMGAAMGRLVGSLLVQASLSNEQAYLSVHQWIDPGVFALIGSAAFVGGVSRLTVSLVVIMLEISAELHFLFPIMLAVMTAKWVGDFFTPSLYHSYLEMKCVPIMQLQRDNSDIDLSKHTALDAVAGEPVCVQLRESITRLCEVLKMTSYNCFPVINGRGLLEGTILRKDLGLLLCTPEVFEQNGQRGKLLTHRQLQDKDSSLFLKGTTGSMKTDWHHVVGEECLENTFIDIGPYLNRSPFTVQTSFSLDLTYDLFTSLGLRHLIVIRREKCMGVLTRKDLLNAALEERLCGGELAQYHDSIRPEWTAEDQLRAEQEDSETTPTPTPSLSPGRSPTSAPVRGSGV